LTVRRRFPKSTSTRRRPSRLDPLQHVQFQVASDLGVAPHLVDPEADKRSTPEGETDIAKRKAIYEQLDARLDAVAPQSSPVK